MKKAQLLFGLSDILTAGKKLPKTEGAKNVDVKNFAACYKC